LAAQVGCARESTTDVRGTVTDNGRALRQGAITFLPVQGSSKPVAAEVCDGQYHARGVPVGEVQVRVTALGDPKQYPPRPLFPTDVRGNSAVIEVTPGLRHDVVLGNPAP
jgi:hypothetical protein